MNSQRRFGWVRLLAAASLALAALDARAQMQVPGAPPPPSVTVTATATATVANDRLQASLRAEAENVSPAAAASQVNAIIAAALADAKAYPAVKVATAGYSTQQIAQKGQPTRWRVTQSITLEAGDFTQAATLMTRLQDQGGLLLSSMGFSISETSRRKAEDGVTQEALKSWQVRAEQAARALGFGGWRVGHVTVQTSGGGPVYPVMRAQAMATPGGAPVAVEAGTTEVTVTVSGDAILQ
jgi:predicted secreted protein